MKLSAAANPFPPIRFVASGNVGICTTRTPSSEAISVPTEIALWRVDQQTKRIDPVAMPLESRLEEIIEADPTMLGEQILLIGRQVATAYGKFVDLMGIDADGNVYVLELKRDRTPRDVVAQVLDYGSWVQDLSNEQIREIFDHYQMSNHSNVGFDQAFDSLFGTNPPEQLNTTHRLTVVASSMDAATERLVTYLANGYNVPINVLFFRYYEDEGRHYLARTWLLDENTAGAVKSAGKSNSKKELWNGLDWYVSFGEEESRDWGDATKYGFVSAGGGNWFSRQFKQVPMGARIFAYIPKVGYVGVGEVVGPAQPYADIMLDVKGEIVAMNTLDLVGTYQHDSDPDEEDRREWVLPIRWIKTVDKSDALRGNGMFANQNSACKLRSKFTLGELAKFFELD